MKGTERDIREQVAGAYTQAVRDSGSCCSSSCCGASADTQAAEQLGYEAAELAALPPDAVEHSFGCGNPLAFADVQPGETVLDLGCGAGIDLLLAAARVGPQGRVIGVDMTDEMIKRARRNAEAAGAANIEVRQGIVEALPVEDASVDLVISNCVLNLSPEKPRAFSEIARVLRPGGRMKVSDMVAENLPDWARDSSALVASCIGGAISEQEYLEGLRAAGLHEVAVVERLAYDTTELAEQVLAELPRAAVDSDGQGVAPEVTAALEARVASILVTARKPD